MSNAPDLAGRQCPLWLPRRDGLRTKLLKGLIVVLVLAPGLLWWERSARLARIVGDDPRLSGWQQSIPNYRHIWFSHDPLFVNSREGSLNNFGATILERGGDWQNICMLDSDGDGITNGQELGDPCCRWRPWRGAGAEPPFSLQRGLEYRRWDLSHPGVNRYEEAKRRHVLTSSPAECSHYNASDYAASFHEFYFRRADDPTEEVPVLVAKVIGLALLLVLIGDWLLYRGLAGDVCPWLVARPQLSGRVSLLLCLASYVYMDFTSGIVHLILDYAPSWLPGIGGLARGFQYHHEDTTAIIRISWYAYVSHIHLLCPVVAVLLVLSNASRASRLFWFWGACFVHLFQTTHRWAHFPPSALHWTVRLLQDAGVVLTHERHMGHHEDLERQFTILSGHMDVVLDKVAQWIPPHRYDLWGFIGVAWFLLPIVLDVLFRGAAERLQLDSTNHKVAAE